MYCITLQYIVFNCAILCCAAICCALFYWTNSVVLYCFALYCNVLCYNMIHVTKYVTSLSQLMSDFTNLPSSLPLIRVTTAGGGAVFAIRTAVLFISPVMVKTTIQQQAQEGDATSSPDQPLAPHPLMTLPRTFTGATHNPNISTHT